MRQRAQDNIPNTLFIPHAWTTYIGAIMSLVQKGPLAFGHDLDREPSYTAARSGDLHLAMRVGIEIVFGLGRGGFETLDPRVQGVFLDNAHTMIPDLEAPASEPITKVELGMVTCPTLICCGERTHPQYQLMAESTLSGLANRYFRQFSGVGDGDPVQVPNHFAEVVLEFVDAVPVSAMPCSMAVFNSGESVFASKVRSDS